MLNKAWNWHKEKKKKNAAFFREDKFIEMQKYWLTQLETWVITKDKCDIEIDKLKLNYQQEQLHSDNKTWWEIAWDLLISTISWTVKSIFSMSWVGKNKK